MPYMEKVAVLVVFGVFAVIAALEVCLLADALRRMVKPGSGNGWFFSKPAIAVHVSAVIGLLCYCYGYFVEPYNVEVNRMTIATDKLSDTSFTVVHISDMHCDMKMRNEEKLVRIVNQIDPDIIVFTGDEVNSKRAVELFKKTLSGLNAKVGKFAVRGNWWPETESNVFYDGTGFKVLERESIALEKDGEVISVGGVNFFDGQSWSQVCGHNDPDVFNIFLYHSPDLVEDVASSNIDLYLAGHTHGGQVCLPFYGAIITFSKFGKKYEAGRYRFGEMDAYINRGLGMEGGRAPRVRFFARPEIAVIDIVPMNDKAVE